MFDRSIVLNNGVKIPQLGLGTWFIDDDKAADAVKAAVEIGYRHIDTAQAYGNERGVGEGVRTCGIPREELFVVSKVAAEHKTYEEAMAGINETLEKMGLDYLDMMIIHSPQPWAKVNQCEDRYVEGNRAAWKALEDAYEAGKLKAIGISNFQIEDIASLLKTAKIKPMVNQILLHISNTPMELVEYCRKNNIVVEAYSPIAHMSKNYKNPTKVITGPKTRWSYANVWDPKSINGGTPKYSVSLIIPKSDVATVKKIEAAIQAAYEEGESKLKGNGKSVPSLKVLKTPLRDGDLERPDDAAYADSYFINANSASAPGIVDADRQPILERSEVYSDSAKQNPGEENSFRQLRLNQWVKQSVRWMPMDKWDACNFKIDEDELEGRICYGGLDLSSTTDITAFVLVFPPLDEEDKYIILPYFWVPEDTLDLRVRRDHVPYDLWERKGYLQTTEGNVVHYGFIEKFIESLL